MLGLGNILRSDEGVGVWAIKRLAAAVLPPRVELVDGGTLGLELLSWAADAQRLLVLDPVDVGQQPGALVTLRQSDLATLPCGGSVHELGVLDLLGALRIMGREPAETVVLGVQPETLSLGVELSAAVSVGLDVLVATAIDQVWAWTTACTSSA